MNTYNTHKNQTCPWRDFCALLYSVRTSCVIVSLSLLFCILSFCLYLQHSKNIQASGGISFLFSVLHLYYFIVLTVLVVPFVLTVQQTQHKHPCPPAGFKPATPASGRPQTLALDRSAPGIDRFVPATPESGCSCFIMFKTAILKSLYSVAASCTVYNNRLYSDVRHCIVSYATFAHADLHLVPFLSFS